MRQSGQPLGWFLTEVWDRWRDRSFWASQQALRHVQAESDVVLYLVNAAESPQAAGYVAPEMDLLAWVGKPVLVLLNQLGAPRAALEEAAEAEAWAPTWHAGRWSGACCRWTPSRAAGCTRPRCCAPCRPCCRASAPPPWRA